MSIVIRPKDIPLFYAVGFQDRVKFLQKLFDTVSKYYKTGPEMKQKLIRKCQFMEYKIAKECKTNQNYKFKLSLLLRDIVKYKGNFKKIDAIKEVLKTSPGNVNSNDSKVYDKLLELLVDEKKLLDSGYIMDVPIKSALMMDKKMEEPSQYVHCLRCDLKFDKGDIMKDTVCKHHVSKGVFEFGTRVYPCCGMQDGCTVGKHHVYKGENALQLLEISEFISSEDIDGDHNVLSLDCEMGYTTLGFEMIRLTIVEFFTEKIVYDKIIQPIGEVIDLNTNFSGVSKIDYIMDPTFHVARDEFMSEKLINKNSLLIGHGLENDLNVMRIVHDKIIDTAILYSSNLKYKTSLKNLSFLELSKRIQVGEHDSSEDAIATLQIVKKKIGI